MELFLLKNKKAERLAHPLTCYYEKEIEDFIESNSATLLGEKLYIVGRQVRAESGIILDLLAIDKTGCIVVIELKRGDAPKDIVKQIMGYSSWAEKLTEKELNVIASRYYIQKNIHYSSLSEEVAGYFNLSSAPKIGGRTANILCAENFSTKIIKEVKDLISEGKDIQIVKFWILGNDYDMYMLTELLTDIKSNFSAIADTTKIVTRNTTASVKDRNFQLFNALKTPLEKEFDSWAFRKINNWQRIQLESTYKTGEWASIRGHWKISEGEIEFCFALDRIDNKFLLRLSFPKKIRGRIPAQFFNLLETSGLTLYAWEGEKIFWRDYLKYVLVLKNGTKGDDFELTPDEALQLIYPKIEIVKELIELIAKAV